MNDADPTYPGGPARKSGHRLRYLVIGVAVVVVGLGVFVGLWVTSGAHEVPLSTADQQFLHSNDTSAGGERSGEPAQGVYPYTGTGTDTLSVPPKTQHDGPLIPGTVTYLANRCWALRLDYSDDHWQSTTFCPSGAELLETKRGGWYRWDFVSINLSDTASYVCNPSEVIVPDAGQNDVTHYFSCAGSNAPLHLGPVTLAGAARVVGSGEVTVQGKKVPAVHVEEIARFTGAQTGVESQSTWVDAADDLPLRGTWSTDVRSSISYGSSTLDATGSFSISSLVPQQ